MQSILIKSKFWPVKLFRRSWIPLVFGSLNKALHEIIAKRKQVKVRNSVQSLLLSTTFENMVQGIAVYSADHNLVVFNPQYAKILGLPSDFLHAGMNRRDILAFRAQQKHYGEIKIDALVEGKLASANQPESSERTLPNGRSYSYERKPTPNGGYISTVTDITERKRAEKSLTKQSELLATTLENMAQGFCVYDDDERLVAFNKEYVEIMGFPPGFIHLGINRREVVQFLAKKGNFGKGDIETLVEGRMTSVEAEEGLQFERQNSNNQSYIFTRKLMPNGGFVGTYTDITERKRAEKSLTKQSELLATTFENMAQGFYVFDVDLKLVAFNQKYLDAVCIPEELVRIGISYEEILRYRCDRGDFGHTDLDTIMVRRTKSIQSGEERWNEFTNPVGKIITIHRRAMPDGGFVTTFTDITERKRAEEKFRTVFEHVTAGSIAINEAGVIELYNSAAESIFGYSAEEVIGRNVGMLMPEPDRGNHDGYIRSYLNTGDARIIGSGREVTGLRKNGEEFPMHLGIGEMTFADQRSFIASITDLTDLKTLEQQLNRAQRLESVGQLTGGIAHDFNNLMSVMNFNIEMLRDKSGKDKQSQSNLDKLELAVDRASSLTDRMLAFSRQQLLTPRGTDIYRLIMELDDMLHSTLEETIDLRIIPDDVVWPLLIDPSQLENALVNLAVNARDAMTQGGTLTIEATNFTLDAAHAKQHEEMAPGDYVNITVSDTGAGIAPDILEKVFEPFFTTKEVGKGSGLGLSMVYGFVKQSNGHITIDSEVGQGTTIRIYLPRSRQSLTPEDFKDDTKEFAQRSERILVVEDDPNVREGPVNILRNQGYQVVEAGDGKEAIKCLQATEPFDLLFTDIVLPGCMGGIEIAEEAKQMQPDIKVLFTTGYAEDTVSPHGKLEADLTLINKPYRRAELLSKVQGVLEDQRLKKPTLLIIDDEPEIAEFVGVVADEMGFEVRVTTTTDAFQQSYMESPPSVIMMDVVMPGMDGIELLHWLEIQNSVVPIALMSGYSGKYLKIAEKLGGARESKFIDTLKKPLTRSMIEDVLKKIIL